MFCAFLFVSCGDETEEPAPDNGGQQTTVCTQHAPVKDGEDKAATCTEKGYQAGTKCSVCNTVLSDGEEIPAKGHNHGAWEVVTEATCVEAGQQKKTCPDCGDVITEAIPATGVHTYVDGVCTGCGAEEVVTPSTFDTLFENAGKFTEAGFAAFEITEDLDEGVISAFWFTDKMNMNYVYAYELADAAAAEAYAATLQAPGATATVIDNVVVFGTADAVSYVKGEAEPQPPAPPCEHTNTTTNIVAGEAATCGTAGYHFVVTVCAECGFELSSELVEDPATGEHTYVDGVCSVCGDVEEIVIPGPCDEHGEANEYGDCSVCGYFIGVSKYDEYLANANGLGQIGFGMVTLYDDETIATFQGTATAGFMVANKQQQMVHVIKLISAELATLTAEGLKTQDEFVGATIITVGELVLISTGDELLSYVKGEAEPQPPITCEHPNTTTNTVAGEAATCVTAGYHFVVTVCDDCGFEFSSERVEDPATGEHTFVDGVCSVCGEKENGAGSDDCAHEYDWKFANNVHWKECTICGDKIGEAVHSWDEYGIVCLVCGYDYFENDHECEFSEEWSHDANYHWHAAICGHEDEKADRDEHIDENGDNLCDVCDCAIVAPYDPEDKYVTYNWGNTEIFVCLNENSNNKELTSNLRRYLAGDTTEDDIIDDMVADRNARAIQTTHVDVKYTYWGAGDTDNANSQWGHSIERMTNLVLANAPGSPDIYCNQIYDMVSASLKGCFANIRTTKLSGGDNNFSFMEPEFEEYRAVSGEEWGYMMEYMTELGFSIKKQYLIASDYFIDLVRAFFIVPMNLNLLAEIDIDSSTGDKDDDGDFDVDDFYAMVMEGDWTYDTLVQYGEAIFSGTSGNINGSMEDRNGFILTPSNGMFSSALLYTTSIKIFDRQLEEDGFYHVTYKPTNEELYDFCDALAELVQAQSVYVESVSHLAIREQFVADNVLFGGVALLGSLEDAEYQAMKSNGGFGILPMPLYREGDNYLTIIHNMGRIAGIAATTTEFAQCSAFVDYQSTHSTKILDEYYEYKLQYDMAGGTKGNIEILKYIRKNVRSAFDKTYEDAIGFYFKGADTQSSKNSWAGILSENNFEVTTMRSLYITNKDKRVSYLEEIIKAYDKLPE